MTPDVLKVAPKTTKVLFENDRIRVLEMKFKKGQKLVMHSHPPQFVYAITAMRFKSTSPDGKASLVRMKKGESSFSEEPSTHAVENHTPGTILAIELK